jgi:hypothetical protein
VAGVSGWQITKNGAAEFNNGTFRGSIEVGSLTGQHFIVNNVATGDVVDVYDSSNTLVAKIDKFGEIITTNGTDSALMFGNGYNFVNFSAPPGSYGGMTGSSSSSGSHVVVDSGRKATGHSSNIFFLDDANGPGGQAALVASQRSGPQGLLVQTDQYSATNNYFHAASYSGTTDASGHLIFSHGCNFTPTGAVITGQAPAVGTFPNLTFGTDGFTSTLANVSFIIANTNVAYANSSVMFNAIFYG